MAKYKLKYVGAEQYPAEFIIPTYLEIVKVVNGIAEVEHEITVDRLLKEGFVLYEEKKEIIELENNPEIVVKSKKTLKQKS